MTTTFPTCFFYVVIKHFYLKKLTKERAVSQNSGIIRSFLKMEQDTPEILTRENSLDHFAVQVTVWDDEFLMGMNRG